jgi:glutamine cyclotransferase
LGPGWITLEPLVTDEPPIRSYICPWLELSEDLPRYTYQVVNTYPHDPSAYTQGLVYQDGALYESTGLRGNSSIRKVDLETGEIVELRPIPVPYFAEGIAFFTGRIYQLTWQESTTFVYDPITFETVTTFNYDTEGWGLTHDGNALIMSDGTEHLTIRDPENFEVLSTISVYSEAGAVGHLNELEYVDGEVWANVYQTSCIARIDPQNGRVKGWIDISGLLTEEEVRTAQVPNGIAFDPQTDRLLVTGKFWPKLFEIEIVPAPEK